jgi:preprotein translocase subunit SecE
MKWLTKLRKFINGTIEELYKCTWPTRQELFRSTVIVLVAVVAVAVFVGLVDFGSQRIIRFLTTGF